MNQVRTIKNYYEYVDSKEVDALLELFTDDVEYLRAGVIINTKEKLEKFYEKERNIDGVHLIDSIYKADSTKDIVIVEGVFIFESKERIAFVDVFEFLGDLVAKRRTYLSVGNELIQ